MDEDASSGDPEAVKTARVVKPAAADTESTAHLLGRVLSGDQAAAETLFARYLPLLRRWARGRLPRRARDLGDTEDLVQEALLHALRHLDGFQWRGEGALQAYLRQAIVNRIRDHVRRVTRRPVQEDLAFDATDPGLTPLEEAIGRENVERYERALERVRPADREAIIGRLELQQTYDELATALAKPSADAARVATIRAVHRLIEEMQRHG